jgi:SAM-dependent methyltransferase
VRQTADMAAASGSGAGGKGKGKGGPDDPNGSDDDLVTTGHPSAHLRPAPDLPEGPDQPLSAVFPAQADLPYDVVSYGPEVAGEPTVRLLGHVDGKRILDLGCGAGHNAIALAKQGAHVIAVDPANRRLEQVRRACDQEEVRVELHKSDLAELAFVRADTIDAVLSVFALASVPDLDRVFRQAHRVLRPESPLVFSLPHPAFVLTHGGSYFDGGSENWEVDGVSGTEHHRTISDLFTSLGRAHFRVDTILEPRPTPSPRSPFWVDAMARAPATLLVRARKEGL